MRSRTKWLIVGGAAAVAAVPLIASAGSDVDVPIDGADLDRASAVALEHVGHGMVTGTEVGDEESFYEVELTLEDGSQVDVALDEGFRVVGTEGHEGEDEGSEHAGEAG